MCAFTFGEPIPGKCSCGDDDVQWVSQDEPDCSVLARSGEMEESGDLLNSALQ